MLTLFKTFDKFLNSFNFEFEMNPEQMFKDIKHEKTEEKGSDENSTWHQETWTSENGKYSYYKKVTKYQPKQETKKEPTLLELKQKLEDVLKEQKYEEAIKLRDAIKEKEKGQ